MQLPGVVASQVPRRLGASKNDDRRTFWKNWYRDHIAFVDQLIRGTIVLCTM